MSMSHEAKRENLRRYEEEQVRCPHRCAAAPRLRSWSPRHARHTPLPPPWPPQAVVLSDLGIQLAPMDGSEGVREAADGAVVDATPYLVNLNEDPLFSETLKYPLRCACCSPPRRARTLPRSPPARAGRARRASGAARPRCRKTSSSWAPTSWMSTPSYSTPGPRCPS